jgi:hypothetical protein
MAATPDKASGWLYDPAMRRLPILPAIMAASFCAIAPAGAVTPLSPLRCTIEKAVNRSIGEPTGLEGTTTLFLPAELTVDGADFTAQRVSSDPHGEEVVRYHIRRAGLAFEATAYRKRHDIGEEHILDLAGRCVRAAQ